MSEFHRMITYLYLYEENQKTRNTGFAKIEKRDNCCLVEIHMKNTGCRPISVPVYFYTQNNTHLVGVKLGEINLSLGTGDFKEILDVEHIAGSSYSLSDVKGIFIPVSDSIMFVSQWDNTEFNRTLFTAPSLYQSKSSNQIPHLKAAEAALSLDSLETKSNSFQRGSSNEMQKKKIVQQQTQIRQHTQARLQNQTQQQHQARTQNQTQRQNQTRPQNPTQQQNQTRPQNPTQQQNQTSTQNQTQQQNQARTQNQTQQQAHVEPQTLPQAQQQNQTEPQNQTQQQTHAEPQILPQAQQQTQTEPQILPQAQQQMQTEPQEQTQQQNQAEPQSQTQQQNQEPEESWELKWRFILESLPVMTPFAGDENTICVRMELKDLRLLPKYYWYLGNNSFLLHGFFNYRYMILGMTEESGKKRWFIGIPGVFQNPERVMASLFGFPYFRNEKSSELNTGEFGYWYRHLEE
ncbi:MAG: DUF6128 domain-containing protein [Lachnospiraceae bacterium]